MLFQLGVIFETELIESIIMGFFIVLCGLIPIVGIIIGVGYSIFIIYAVIFVHPGSIDPLTVIIHLVAFGIFYIILLVTYQMGNDIVIDFSMWGGLYAYAVPLVFLSYIVLGIIGAIIVGILLGIFLLQVSLDAKDRHIRVRLGSREIYIGSRKNANY
jgi:hypothetical protein